MNNYTKIRVLGEGSFGQAWLVNLNNTIDNYVIKTISIPAMNERDKQAAINEVKILSTLRHRNIVLYKDAFVHDKYLCLVMEYADDGDLAEKIKNQNGELFTETQVIDWFVQILIAVKYIHNLNILHRDLKSQNIFLTLSGFVKIGDFGVSKYLDSGLHQAKTTIGTPFYLSPEICQQKPYDHKSDMWSLGVLTYEMVTLKHPFTANNFANLVVKIVKGDYPPLNDCYGPLLEDLILVLLQVSPSDRPSASHLLKAPLLQPHVQKYLHRVKHGITPFSLKSYCSRRRGSLDSEACSNSDSSTTSTTSCTSNTDDITAPREILDHCNNDMNGNITEQRPPENKENQMKIEKIKDAPPLSKNKSLVRRKSLNILSNRRRWSYDSVEKKDDVKLKTERRTSLGSFQKLIEKPPRGKRRGSTGTVANSRDSTVQGYLTKHPTLFNVQGQEKHSIKNEQTSNVTAKTTSIEKQSPKSKRKINFIERNKKLLENSSSKGTTKASSQTFTGRINKTHQQDHIHPTFPQQQLEAKKKCNKENVPTKQKKYFTEKSQQEKSPTANYTELPTPEDKCHVKVVQKERSSSVDDRQQKQVKALALKKRSASYDNKKSFLKKVTTTILPALKKQNEKKIIKNKQNEIPHVECSKSDLCMSATIVINGDQRSMYEKSSLMPDNSSSTTKKRHTSSAFPEGYQVKDTVRKNIIGRMRASSHACERQGDRIQSSERKRIQNAHQNKLDPIEYTKTYIILDPLHMLRNHLQLEIGQPTVQKCMDIMKGLKLTREDHAQLMEVWKILKKANGRDGESLLLSMIELNILEDEHE